MEIIAAALARLLAWAGGIALLGVVALTCLSILGRAGGQIGLPFRRVPGDVELVEMGIGFAVFAFLAFCHQQRANAVVDLFQPLMSRGLDRLITAISDILILVAASLILWRLVLGMLDKAGYGETTYILRLPAWWSYAGATVGATGFVLVSLVVAAGSLAALAGRRQGQHR